jgi:hypothetical protein
MNADLRPFLDKSLHTGPGCSCYAERAADTADKEPLARDIAGLAQLAEQMTLNYCYLGAISHGATEYATETSRGQLVSCGASHSTARLLDPRFPVRPNGCAGLMLDEPVAVLRNTTAPPVAPDRPVTVTLTTGVLAPEGSVSRIRQGDGAHVKYRARGLALLLICKSTVSWGDILGKGLFRQTTSDQDRLARKTAQNYVVLATSEHLGLVS